MRGQLGHCLFTFCYAKALQKNKIGKKWCIQLWLARLIKMILPEKWKAGKFPKKKKKKILKNEEGGGGEKFFVPIFSEFLTEDHNWVIVCYCE